MGGAGIQGRRRVVSQDKGIQKSPFVTCDFAILKVPSFNHHLHNFQPLDGCHLGCLVRFLLQSTPCTSHHLTRCARVSPGKLLPLQPERDLKISNLSLGTNVQNGRTTVQLHFKPLKWDEKDIVNELTPRTISSTIICVLAPGMVRRVLSI